MALAIALIAAAAAIAAWLHPAHKHFSGEQSAQAKTNVCSAYAITNRAVFVGTPDPRPGDPVAQLSVAANVRLALLGGGAYLRETVAAEPAAPADLANAANSMANTLEQMGLHYLARSNNSVLISMRQDLNSQVGQINKLCGATSNK